LRPLPAQTFYRIMDGVPDHLLWLFWQLYTRVRRSSTQARPGNLHTPRPNRCTAATGWAGCAARS
jgi:hypothetical protein